MSSADGTPYASRLLRLPQHERLAALVGTWRTEGRRQDGGAIEATDVYSWLPGRRALLHEVDARVGDEHVVGAEIIGYDPARRAYVTQYFGSDGANCYKAGFEQHSGLLLWRMRSRRDRFMGLFDEDGDAIEGHWELRDGDTGWRPWMDVRLTRRLSDSSGASETR